MKTIQAALTSVLVLAIGCTPTTNCNRCGFSPRANVLIKHVGGANEVKLTNDSGCVSFARNLSETCDQVTVIQP